MSMSMSGLFNIPLTAAAPSFRFGPMAAAPEEPVTVGILAGFSPALDLEPGVAAPQAATTLAADLGPRVAAPQADATPLPIPQSVGIFVTGQSVATFTAASALISLVWKVLGLVYPVLSSNKEIPLVLALFVGMLIYWQSELPSQDRKSRIIGFSFALLNSFTLAAAALGIDSAANGSHNT